MARPSKDEYFLRMAALVAERSTCLRRAVGCVLVDARGHVLATGYNGVAAGQPHCNEVSESSYVVVKKGPLDEAIKRYERDFSHIAGKYSNPRWGKANLGANDAVVIDYAPHACPGANAASGTQLETCEAIHGEQNALLQARDVHQIHTCYVTHSPCITCVKLLMNTSCTQIVFRERYAHDQLSQELWLRNVDYTWEHLPA